MSLFFLFLTLAVTLLFTLFYVSYFSSVQKLKSGDFLPQVNIYTPQARIFKGQILKKRSFITQLKHSNFRLRHEEQKLLEKDYSLWSGSFCEKTLQLQKTPQACLVIYTSLLQALILDENSVVIDILSSSQEGFQSQNSFKLSHELIGQVHQDKLVLQEFSPLSQIPLYCIHSTLAAEDTTFLEHKGFNLKAISRAFVRNLVAGKYVQGGSTITQQLVKNFFLTSEKTLLRKIKEVLLSVFLELNVDKDKILETYFNIIYMGQKGPYQIRGFSSAASFYFEKPLKNISLGECALLSSLIKSPGGYNPFKKPRKALQRRDLVLSQMKSQKWITEEQFQEASLEALPAREKQISTPPLSPYLTQSLVTQLKNPQEHLKVYVTIDTHLQKIAAQAIQKGLKNLEKKFPKKNHQTLEASLVSVHIPTGEVLAMIGGRSFKKSQFNRALEARRQIGSLIKPFVYLTAFENPSVHPLTQLKDLPFTYKYEGQIWSPKNYKNKFLGEIPLYSALLYSLNASTARFSLEQIGLKPIRNNLQKIFPLKNIPLLPSLVLGSFELTPLEVTQAYLALATGFLRKPQFIDTILNSHNKKIQTQETHQNLEEIFEPQARALTISILKQVMIHGTAKLSYLRGLKQPLAGKTGTTNNSQDSWFAGFSPDILTVVWVGYDDNLSNQFTGSSAALPIWIDFMKKATSLFPPRDFSWPSDLKKISFKPLVKIRKHKNLKPENLMNFYFREKDQDKVLKALQYWYEKKEESEKK